MCSGSTQRPSDTSFIVGGEFKKQTVCNIISIFLESLGFDDLIGFKSDVEKECHGIDEPSLWYERRIGFKDDWICREDSPHES